MSIGPLIPGTRTTVTPDAGHAGYTSAQGPAVDGEIVADDVLIAIQVALNVQASADRRLLSGSLAQMIALTGVSPGYEFDATGYGRYLAASSYFYDGSPWIVVSVGTPGIVWIHANAAVLVPYTNQGICRIGPAGTSDTTTPNGKIPSRVVQNSIVETKNIFSLTPLSRTITAGNSYIFDGWVCEFSAAAAGDIITGSLGPFHVSTSSSVSPDGKLRVLLTTDVNGDNENTSYGRECLVGHAGGCDSYITIPFRVEVDRPGTASIRLEALAQSDVPLVIWSADEYFIGHAMLIRP